MKTYTIATLGDLIIATAPDNSDIDVDVAHELENNRLSRVDSDGNEYFYTVDDCEYHEGYTLTEKLPDGIDAEFESGNQGWITDESGATYTYAYKI